jgi:hypothetical protein
MARERETGERDDLGLGMHARGVLSGDALNRKERGKGRR